MSEYNRLLEEMDHYDPDNRFMATDDLCRLMLNDQSIDANLEKQCIDAFLKRLDDKITDVKSKTVQCLGRICSNVREQNLKVIVKSLVEKILEGDKDCRDINSSCCQEIMKEISEDFSKVIISSIYPTIQRGLKHSDDEVKEEFCELLTEMLRQFSKTLAKDPSLLDQNALLKQLLKLLGSKSEESLKKKTTQCIGFLAVILTHENIDYIVQTLESSLTKNKKDYFAVQALSWISSKVGHKLGNLLDNLLTTLFSVCDLLDMNTSEDDINAVVEEALNAVEYLVLRCPKEIQSHVEAILKTAQSFISFDPNYNYDAADEAMEDGEDWGDEEDEWDEPGMDMNFDDDSSWKVRRSSIKVILAVIRS